MLICSRLVATGLTILEVLGRDKKLYFLGSHEGSKAHDRAHWDLLFCSWWIFGLPCACWTIRSLYVGEHHAWDIVFKNKNLSLDLASMQPVQIWSYSIQGCLYMRRGPQSIGERWLSPQALFCRITIGREKPLSNCPSLISMVTGLFLTSLLPRILCAQ